jgi:hypothetical protein
VPSERCSNEVQLIVPEDGNIMPKHVGDTIHK